MKKWKKWTFALLLVAALAAAGFWVWTTLGTTKVTVALPSRREAVRAIFATGSVKAEQLARIRTEVGGEVTAVNVKQGMEIYEGDPVMAIKVEEQQNMVSEQTARVREAQVAVSEAKTNYDRESQLLAEGATTQEAVDRAKAALDRASAFLRTVRTVLNTRRTQTGKGKLTAPITGVVTEVNVNVGDVVPPNVEAVVILDPSSFKVVANIDEADISRIRPGQEAIIAFDALPRSRFRARVDRIIPQADEVTKTLPVFLTLTDAVPNLSDGLTATVNIVQERKSAALMIPVRSIFNERSGEASVFVVDEANTLRLKRVKLGIRGEEYVEVLSGVEERDRLVLGPDPEWGDGRVVEIDKAKMKQQSGLDSGSRTPDSVKR